MKPQCDSELQISNFMFHADMYLLECIFFSPNKKGLEICCAIEDECSNLHSATTLSNNFSCGMSFNLVTFWSKCHAGN